ncbi:MAG: 50S ribosomal protein L9 [bacterium ADurb.Bin157]|jgi:large subunit ribosomal protein L9|nr:50S ribosomal protein L9 [Candidatus Riflebacteria bacterium]MDD2624866.1 50S ribosomal protein L9 [Candidatus Riflebacteria bacterium]MDD3377364.1 50S ribosomal protein L9 [Candidatus Riflebacteria bacterium]NLV94563.1 50S ribosomal protein L9 [Candidatus Riflebacteria bacterium]OQB50317.1 MAG: 50S ribosomal protein L9 [bacterium ADurb.Bin157]
MEVLMINTVPRVGRKGEFKTVAEGFARNYLFPRNFAIPATEGAKKHFNLMKDSWEKQILREKQMFAELAQKIEGTTVTITRRAGDKGRLFGSVTSAELAEEIKKASGVEIDKKLVVADHIKEVGEHDVTIRFTGEVKAALKIVVVAEVKKD